MGLDKNTQDTETYIYSNTRERERETPLHMSKQQEKEPKGGQWGFLDSDPRPHAPVHVLENTLEETHDASSR